jgi:hypothetical protein
MRRQNGNFEPYRLFGVGEVEKEWCDVVPRITRERRG